MLIDTIELKEFGAFANARVPLSPGVNVIVGANGTGKSHLMKIAYAALRAYAVSPRTTLSVEQRLEEQIAETFQPDDANVGRIVRRRVGRGGLGGGNNKATVRVILGAVGSEGVIEFTMHTKGARRVRVVREPKQPLSGSVVFLPPHEMLTMSTGLVSLAHEYSLPFDATYVDAATALARPTLKRRPAFLQELEQELAESLGGEVIREEDRFYVRLRGGGKMEAPLLAEGLRKLAALIRLMQNGGIRRGSVLFWDEPEANLNPILSKTVTQTIYALARHEVQVVLATHDYLLASRLSLLAQDNTSLKDPLVRFIGLTAPGDEDGSVLEVSGGTQVGVGDKLEDLPRPLLVEALTQHADFEQRLLLNRLIEA